MHRPEEIKTKAVRHHPDSDLITVPVHCPVEGCERIEYQNAHSDYLKKGGKQPVRFRCEGHGFYRGTVVYEDEQVVVRLRKLMTYMSEDEWTQTFQRPD